MKQNNRHLVAKIAAMQEAAMATESANILSDRQSNSVKVLTSQHNANEVNICVNVNTANYSENNLNSNREPCVKNKNHVEAHNVGRPPLETPRDVVESNKLDNKQTVTEIICNVNISLSVHSLTWMI